MIITRFTLLSDLVMLNSERSLMLKDQEKYQTFIKALDQKFALYIDQHPDGREEFLLWVVFTLFDFNDRHQAKDICRRWWLQTADPVALIFHAWMLDQYEDGVTPELFEQMQQFVNEPDNMTRSMLNLFLAMYYNGKPNMRETRLNYLKASVAAFPNNVRSYIELGKSYAQLKHWHDAVFYYKSAIYRVETVYPEHDQGNLFSGKRYVKELILWSHCTREKFECLQQQLRKVSPL